MRNNGMDKPIILEEFLVLKCLENNSEREKYLISLELEDTPDQKLSEKARFIVNRIKLKNGIGMKWN